MEEKGKLCRKCDTVKPTTKFAKDKNRLDGLNPYCQTCNSLGMKIWRQNNPERYAETQRRFQLSQYNLTAEEYDALLQKQNNVCAICSEKSTRQHFDIDHCHETGKVRGLLCNQCNRGLGQFKDNLVILKKAVNYMEQNESCDNQ